MSIHYLRSGAEELRLDELETQPPPRPKLGSRPRVKGGHAFAACTIGSMFVTVAAIVGLAILGQTIWQ